MRKKLSGNDWDSICVVSEVTASLPVVAIDFLWHYLTHQGHCFPLAAVVPGVVREFCLELIAEENGSSFPWF